MARVQAVPCRRSNHLFLIRKWTFEHHLVANSPISSHNVLVGFLGGIYLAASRARTDCDRDQASGNRGTNRGWRSTWSMSSDFSKWRQVLDTAGVGPRAAAGDRVGWIPRCVAGGGTGACQVSSHPHQRWCRSGKRKARGANPRSSEVGRNDFREGGAHLACIEAARIS